MANWKDEFLPPDQWEKNMEILEIIPFEPPLPELLRFFEFRKVVTAKGVFFQKRKRT